MLGGEPRPRVVFLHGSQASEILFGDAWLFRAPRNAEATEVLAMLGQPDCRGAHMCVANWESAEACARELAEPLGVSADALLTSSSDEEDGESDASGVPEETILWTVAADAMQVRPIRALASRSSTANASSWFF